MNFTYSLKNIIFSFCLLFFSTNINKLTAEEKQNNDSKLNQQHKPTEINQNLDFDNDLSINSINKDDGYIGEMKNTNYEEVTESLKDIGEVLDKNENANFKNIKNSMQYIKPIKNMTEEAKVSKIYRLNSDVKIEDKPNDKNKSIDDIKIIIDYNLKNKKDYYSIISDAYEALERGKYDISREYYQKAFEIDPKSYDAVLGLGNSYHLLGQKKEAMKYYLMALKIKPDSKKVMNNVLSILSATDADVAIFELKKIYKTKKNDSRVTGHIGLIYAQKGEYMKALKYFKRANYLDSANALNIYNTAIVYENLNDFKMAYSHYMHLLSLPVNVLASFDISEKNIKDRAKLIMNNLK